VARLCWRIIVLPAALAVLGVLGTALPAAASAAAVPSNFAEMSRAVEALARDRIAFTDDVTPPRRYAYFTAGDRWRFTGADGWAAAYAPGGLWSCYQMTGVTSWRDRALKRQSAIGRNEVTSASVNLGALFVPTYVRGYELTGDHALQATALKAAQAMAGRYNPIVGAMLSRPGDRFNVIIDSLMKSQLLWWAARNGGDSTLADIATQHALTIARDFVREDGSTWHLVYYDTTTGAVTERSAGSAFSVDSTWARGQAWAVLGFAAAYRATGDQRFLDIARKVTDWYLANLPADQIPYWDFLDPAIPLAARDSSAAAIAASGMIDLSLIDPSGARRVTYLNAARSILGSLMSSSYLSLAANPAVLLHGTYSQTRGVVDCGLAYGDAFFLEALLRLRRTDPGVTPLRIVRAKAAKGDPSLAVDGDLTTAWTSRGRVALDVRLPSVSDVGGVRVAIGSGDRRAAVLRVSVSTDGITWTPVLRTMTSGETAGFETLDFDATPALWVRVTCDGTTTGPVNRISELQVLPSL
jgi:unsaturated chondroitin disaccharide hydrolase